MLLYAVLEMLLATADSQFTLTVQGSSVEIGDFVHCFSSDSEVTVNVFPLLMAAIFFALSYVFKYGVLLQQQSDETL